VQIDALAVRLRPRTPYEAADLGTRMCQSAARDAYTCLAIVALPVFTICLATVEFAAWLPLVTLWWVKPWLDRTVLFVLSRAAFGQRTSPADLWAAQRQVLWSQLFLTLTWRRLSPWRSFTQPVYQLEGLSWSGIRTRVVQLRRRRAGSALLVTWVYKLAEASLITAIVSFFYWFAPAAEGQAPGILEVLSSLGTAIHPLVLPAATALVILFLEPFYVASGFAMYLSRRAELEAWDIEQEFRRAFAR
jgi:hypothetical protein